MELSFRLDLFSSFSLLKFEDFITRNSIPNSYPKPQSIPMIETETSCMCSCIALILVVALFLFNALIYFYVFYLSHLAGTPF